MRVMSFNANGIRAAQRKGFFEWMAAQDPDVVCIQELKAQQHQLEGIEAFWPAGYHCFYEEATSRKGYSGVAIYSKRAPDQVIRGMGHPEFDAEGRYIEAVFEQDDGPLRIASLYAPSGSSGDHRQDSKERYLVHFPELLAARAAAPGDYLVCGDLNIAHKEIDLKNWKSNQKNSGFLPEEREWMSRVLDEQGWVDAYRHLYPEHTGEAYTWWSNRGQAWANNVGWRIDYQLVTPNLRDRLREARVYKDTRFSDHAPLIVDYAD